jgi:IAA-amino acid hydrolase
VEYNEGNEGYPALVNDAGMYGHMRRVGRLIFGDRNVKLAKPTMAGEDFAFYLKEQVPGAMLILGITANVSGGGPMVHSPYFSLDEDALPLGAAMNAALAEMYVDSSADDPDSGSVDDPDSGSIDDPDSGSIDV